MTLNFTTCIIISLLKYFSSFEITKETKFLKEGKEIKEKKRKKGKKKKKEKRKEKEHAPCLHAGCSSTYAKISLYWLITSDISSSSP
jgi:hypothetical protein